MHRGLGQGFSKEGLTGKTCTASRMLLLEHGFLENTIPSIDVKSNDAGEGAAVNNVDRGIRGASHQPTRSRGTCPD